MGSIPFGYLIPKMRGIDIRTIGSKATSSTNVSRALGWRWGIVNIVLDVSKSYIPVAMALRYLSNPWEAVVVALMPVAGHVFPVWLNFKGGKGGAPFYGALIAFIGISSPLVLLGLAFFIAILAVFKRTSVANLSLPWILAVLIFSIKQDIPLTVYSILGAIIITIALRENIKRLMQRTEPKTPFKF
jgi:glycerol-3-phosphate acyltransferase PlsY